MFVEFWHLLSADDSMEVLIINWHQVARSENKFMSYWLEESNALTSATHPLSCPS